MVDTIVDTAKMGLLVVPLALLTGCSVFGIATKGDLAKHQAAQQQRDEEAAAQVQAVNDELQSVRSELAEVDKALATRMGSVEQELAALDGVREQINGLASRLEDARLQLTNLEGRTRQELERMDDSVSLVATGAAEARELAATADERGRLVSSAYADGLRAEKRRLNRELEDIEERIATIGTAELEMQTRRDSSQRAAR